MRRILYKKRGKIKCPACLPRGHSQERRYDPSIQELTFISENLQDRRDSIAFIVSELLRQPTTGEGITMLSNAIGELIPIQELQSFQRRILDAHPDLWQAWLVNGWRWKTWARTKNCSHTLRNRSSVFPSAANCGSTWRGGSTATSKAS